MASYAEKNTLGNWCDQVGDKQRVDIKKPDTHVDSYLA